MFRCSVCNKNHKGIMVALPVPPQTANILSLLQGMFHLEEFTKPDDMHVTLLYLEVEEVEPQALAMALERFAGTRRPLTGRVNGTGQFGHGAYYVSVDVPEISAFRQDLARYLSESLGVRVADSHGFVPHITLAYTDPKVNVPVDLPVEFTSLLLAWGDTKVTFRLHPLLDPIRDKLESIFGDVPDALYQLKPTAKELPALLQEHLGLSEESAMLLLGEE